MPAKSPHASVVSGVFNQPFTQQVAFFRNKMGNLIPTQRWNDITREQHDTGFMVAGAQKADLLADLAVAVERSITEGKGIEAFRKDFKAIVEQRGWHGWTGEGSEKGEAWRTRVIYQTNSATSYAAGREAQLQEGGFEFAVYKHSGSAHPRQQHLLWDSLTLPVDHPFWQTHSPVNAIGCECYKVGARNERGAKRLGGDPDKTLPEGWDTIDPKTGTPPGIGKGFDYAPGASVSHTVRTMAEKTRQWPYELAKAYMQEVPPTVRDQLATSYRALPSVATDARLYARSILEPMEGVMAPPYSTLGLLTERDAKQLAQLTENDVAGFDFALDVDVIKHVFENHGDDKVERKRGQRAVTASDYAKLPLLLNTPDKVQDVGTADNNQAVVRYQKELDGELYSAIFSVRRKRKMLVLKTFYIGVGGK